MRSLSLIILGLLLVLGSTAVWGQKAAKGDDAAEYDALLGKLKAGDTSVDFKALRIAFTRTKAYSPQGGLADDVKAAFAAIDKKDYKTAVKKAEQALKESYVDMDAHIAASLAYGGAGNTPKADFHKAVYLGLVNSILKSGDGKTPETAYVVISAHEEYITLSGLGLQPAGQSLINGDKHTFDLMRVVDPKTKAESKIYFNIDISWKAETDMFK